MKLRTIGRQTECQAGEETRAVRLPCGRRQFRVVPAWCVAGILLVTIASNGCYSLLIQGPNSEALRGRLPGDSRTEIRQPNEVVLVDRTGQAVGSEAESAAADSRLNGAEEPTTADRVTRRNAAEQVAAASETAELTPPRPTGNANAPPATTGRISAWSDFDLDLPLNTGNAAQSTAPATPAVNSQPSVQTLGTPATPPVVPPAASPMASAVRASVEPMTSTNRAEINQAAARATAVDNRTSQAQSFRVQVTGDQVTGDQAAPSPRERQVWDAAQQAREEAKAAAMFQAVQQVTQQGMSRLSGTGGDATASPALANLLMEQVQGSLSEQQIQAANLALDNWDSMETMPTFDLRGNRPLRQPASAGDLAGEQHAQVAGGREVGTGEQAQAYGPQGYRPASLGSGAEDDEPQSQPSGWTDAAPTSSARIPTTAAITNDPVNDEHWRAALQKAMLAVERAIPQAAHTQEQQSLEIYLRLLRLLAGDTDQAVGTIESLPKDRQAFWREQIFALSQIVQAPAPEQEAMLVNHSRQATKALAHLHNAMQALQNEATLQLRQVQFCQEIRSFGDYDRAKSTLVAAGDPMLIYCEVVNYRSERISDGNGEAFQTNLVPSYLIFDDRQKVVSQKEFAVVRDQCRSRRQDFYLVLQLEVPNLPRGKYHVQVSVEDVEGGKIAVSVPLSFQVR